MISAIITSQGEPNTLKLQLKAIGAQLQKGDEIVVVCPDEGIGEVILASGIKNGISVSLVRDAGEGKPAALNMGLRKAKGEILVLTDGDVLVTDNAIKNLMLPFENKKVGAVTGRPVSKNGRDTMLGFWSHFLTDSADRLRQKRATRSEFIECSGYLYAIRSGIVKEIPKDTLSDDALVSHMIARQGYKIGYARDTKVEVTYPTTYSDWLKQKVRSTGGYLQKGIVDSKYSMRTFSSEVLNGFTQFFTYPRSLQELVWLKLLFLARVHLWFLVFLNVSILKKPFSELWVRVESTK